MTSPGASVSSRSRVDLETVQRATISRMNAHAQNSLARESLARLCNDGRHVGAGHRQLSRQHVLGDLLEQLLHRDVQRVGQGGAKTANRAERGGKLGEALL